jgi:hypothetical protein
MKQNLESAFEEMAKLDAVNSELAQENKQLKIQYSAQEVDHEHHAREVAKLRREN